MSLSAMVRRMGEAGATPEAIAIALEEIEALQIALDARRTADRDRKRRQREAQKTADVTGHSEDSHGTVTQKENPPDPLKKNPPLNGSPKGEPIPPQTAEEPSVIPEHVLEAWNVMADRAGVPKAKLTPERRRKLSAFIRRHAIDDITEAIHAVERSPFLRGENDRGWRANFDFLLQPSSFTKLIEGGYDRATH